MIRRSSCFLLSLLLAAAVSCIGCDAAQKSLQEEMYKQAIQQVMHESDLTGTEPSDEHTSTLKTIDLMNCPPEFRFAFVKYIHAWEEEVAVRKAEVKLGDDELPSAGEELLAQAFGLNVKPWQEHQQAVQEIQTYKLRAESDLRSTAQDLDDLAVKYGVKVGQ
jgi:hypothetical protein